MISTRIQPIKVLFVDDMQDEYTMIHDFLYVADSSGFDLDWAATYDEALEAIEHDKYDVYLVDNHLGDHTGMELLHHALANGCTKPIILITAYNDIEADISALKIGAADYLDKTEITPPVLARSLRYAVERARNQQALQKSEDRYRDLFENVTDLVQSVTVNGRFEYVNRAWQQTLGYSKEEICSLSVFDIIHPNHLATCKAAFEQVIAGGEVHNIKTVFVSKDNRSIIVEGNINCRFTDGKPSATRGVFRNITDREMAQETLRKLSHAIEYSMASVVITNRAGLIEYVNPYFCTLTGYKPEEVLNQNPRILNSGHTPVETYSELWRTITSGRHWEGEFLNRKKNGELYWEFAHISPVLDNSGTITHFVAIKEDITERKQAQQVEADRRGLLEALLNTAAILNSTLDIDKVIESILASLQQVVPYDTANVMLIESGMARVVLTQGYEKFTGTKAIYETPFNVTATPNLNTIYETGRPLTIADIHNDPGWIMLPESRWAHSYAGTPISADGKFIGFLTLLSAKEGVFTPETLPRLQAFSDQIAVAIKNARQHDQAKQLAAANERERLARDLHDAVSQTLFSASLIAETLPRVWRDIPDQLHEELSELHLLTRQALAEMRSLLLELRPQSLLTTNIKDLLDQLAEAFRRREHTEVVVKVDDQFKFAPDVHIAFFRIAQEALNNIRKHARATRVEISLHQVGNIVELCIRDNGCGFDTNATPLNHHGVRIMYERAESIEATLTLTSQPGSGTDILLTRACD